MVLSLIETGSHFYTKISRTIKDERNTQEKAYVSIFFGYGLCWIVFIIRDYFSSPDIRELLFIIALFIVITFLSIFFYYMEKDQIFFTRYLFTKVSFILTILTVSIILFDINHAPLFGYILFIIEIILFFGIYIIRFYGNDQIREIESFFKLKFIILTFGLAFMGLGFLLTSNPLLSIYGLTPRIYGNIIQLVGITFLYLFFRFVPPLNEYSWKQKINNLYVLLNSGLAIYHKSFRSSEDPSKTQSSAAAIKVINDMLSTITNMDGMSIIEKKNQFFVILPSKYITGVLICDEKFTSYKLLLKRLMQKIEKIYSEFLKEGNLNTKLFDPIEDIAKEVFLF